MSSLRLARRLTRECLRDPLPLAGAAVSLAALAAGQLALPWLIRGWVEGPLAGDGEWAGWVVRAAILVGLIAVCLLVSRLLLARVNQGMLERLRSAAVRRLLSVEPGRLRSYASGDLMSRVLSDAGLLSGFAEMTLKRGVGDALLAIGALTMMFVLDPALATVACLLTPLVAVAMAGLGSLIRRFGVLAQERLGVSSATLEEQLSGFSTIKGYTGEVFEIGRFERDNAAYRRAAVAAEGWSGALVAAVFLLAAAGFVGAVAVGSRQVASGDLDAGGLLAFCLYAGQTVEPLRRLAEMHGAMQRSLAAAARLREVEELPLDEEAPASPAGPRGVPAPRGSAAGAALRVEALRFAHRPGAPVLDGLNVELAAGERLALVGASGAGKSTVASLLVRFLEPDAGRLLIDGVELRQLPRRELRRQVRLVEQEPFLFAGSLLDNVRYGSWGATPEAVAEALALVGLGEWARSDGRGLHAPLGEAGRSLSGGQRQRVALARAILSDPRLLVLDEATSALDSEAEARLLGDLEAWLGRRTVIVIAHRLSTVRRLPRVALLDGGRIVADGPVNRLEAESASFRTLFTDQLDAEPSTVEVA